MQRNPVCLHHNLGPGNGQIVASQVVGGVVSGAGAQRGQQKLLGCHPAVPASAVHRLIADDSVTARFDFKPYIAQVLNANFRRGSVSFCL
jgi:hypothetical protein